MKLPTPLGSFQAGHHRAMTEKTAPKEPADLVLPYGVWEPLAQDYRDGYATGVADRRELES